jgi:hypothetical protein
MIGLICKRMDTSTSDWKERGRQKAKRERKKLTKGAKHLIEDEDEWRGPEGTSRF